MAEEPCTKVVPAAKFTLINDFEALVEITSVTNVTIFSFHVLNFRMEPRLIKFVI